MLFLPARINAPRKVLQNLPHAAQLEASQEIQDLNLSALKRKPQAMFCHETTTMLSLSRRGRAHG